MEQDQVKRAVREAELLCEELTRARIDLELHGTHALLAPDRRRSSRGRRFRTGAWALTLYALVTVLATGTPEVTGSTVFQPTVGVAAEDARAVGN